MYKNRLLKVMLVLFLALGLSGWKMARPLAYLPVDSTWSGYTHLGKPVSFTVQSNGAQWANFSLMVQITFPSTCTVTMTQTINGPGTITNDQFSFNGTYFSFTGQFASDLTVSGTYAFTNQPSECGTFTHNGTWSAMTSLPAPYAFSKTSPPDGATNQSTNAGGMTWTSSRFVYEYEYCIDKVDNDLCDTNWTTTPYTNAGWPLLEPATTYYWQVNAKNPSGTTPANGGAWFTFTTGIPPTAFNKSGPADGSLTGTIVTFFWEPSSTATSYQICVDAIDNQACDGSSWVSTGTNTSRTYSGMTNHITFYWQVQAYNSGGYTEADGGAWRSITTFDPPGPFGKLLPSYQSSNQPTSLTLVWEISAEAEYYEYCYDTSNDNLCDGNWLNAGANTSAAISGLNTSTAYYWQVRAVNQGGVTYTTYDGGWWRFTTAPPSPGSFTKLTPPDGAQTQPPWPTLAWSASAGAMDYEYCFDIVDDDLCNTTWESAGYGTTSAQLSNLTANTTYYWQVQAINGGGTTGADSQTWWSFKTDSAQAGPVYTVNTTAGDKDGLCGLSHCSLRDAVSAAEADSAVSTIQLQAGATYILSGADNSGNGLPAINTSIHIQGNGATLERSREPGAPIFRFFFIDTPGSLTLTALTLRGGSLANPSGGFGGALYNYGQLTLQDSTLTNNSASAGGAIFNDGTAIITNTIFDQNNAIASLGSCGSAVIHNNGSLSISGSTFTGNTASGGDLCGPVIQHQGTWLTITNATFSGHAAPIWSVVNIEGNNAAINDSIFHDNSTAPITVGSSLDISGSIFYNNTAYLSGGIYVGGGSLTVSNSTFKDNTAFQGTEYFSGGAINASGGTVQVINSTFSGNAAAEGGAVFSAYSNFTLKNSILADSTRGGNCGGYGSNPAIVDGGHNLDSGSTCNFSAANGSLSNAAPLLGPLQNNGGPTWTMALQPGSPAIDNGDNAICLANPVNNLDQRGATRPVDSDKNGSALCDLGAYESPAWPLPGAFVKASPSDTVAAQPISLTLSWGPSTDAIGYDYCFDTSDNNTCDTFWISNGTQLNVALGSLQHSTTYAWQVRAANASGTYLGDNGDWWTFTTHTDPPAAFSKSLPAPNAMNQPLQVTLNWENSANATGYEVCYDTSDNAQCDGAWFSAGSNTSVQVNLDPITTYSWQVRAKNVAGTTPANDNAWWTFTSAPIPADFTKTGPLSDAVDQSISPVLTWAASSGAVSYEVCYDSSLDNTCDGTWVSAGSATSAAVSGLTYNTTYSWQVRAVSPAGMMEANNGVWWRFKTIPSKITKTFSSASKYDGWILESGEISGKGGTMDSKATTFNLGDDASRKQYRAILSFNVSLPTNAVITKVVLKIRKQGLTGLDPFRTLGNILVDIKQGSFSNNLALQLGDFNIAASKTGACSITNAPLSGWYSTLLPRTTFGLINKFGVTQFRLRFTKDDDNDSAADYYRFYSGNASTVYRPRLVIEYYVP